MDNASQIVDIWHLFKEHADKKQIEICAEKYIDLVADYGASDMILRECLGNCDYLDEAIRYYLDIGEDDDDYIDNDWDE